MLGPSIVFAATPVAVGYASICSRVAPDKLLARLALVVAIVEVLGLALALVAKWLD